MVGHLRADYLFVLEGKAVAICEVKRSDIKLNSPEVKAQAESYTQALRPHFPCWERPLPLVFLANGKQIFFRNSHDPQTAEYVVKKRFLRPYEMMELLAQHCVKVDLAGYNQFRLLPPLEQGNLRACQIAAITSYEESLRQGKTRALLALATGVGKTRIAITESYRLLRFSGKIARILFLVDRVVLGRAALNAFSHFEINGVKPFTELYGVELLTPRTRLSRNRSGVFIGTIQGLYARLKGSAYEDTIRDVLEDQRPQTPLELPLKPQIAPDYFDAIVIDECHRSIYNEWGLLFDYFKPVLMLGLTATPIAETLTFFRHLAYQYPLEQSYLDGINVPPVVARMSTAITQRGGIIQAGEYMLVKSKYTGIQHLKQASSCAHYAATELNETYLAPDQIRTIAQSIHDATYTSFYPERAPDFDIIPKMLIFAKNEYQADLIVRIFREVYGRTDEHFVQKITYSVPNAYERIVEFRYSRDFRIAATVNLMATGTDNPAIEMLVFMTDVHSEVLYQQMVGRGVRTISPDLLHEVTPNALHKDRFIIVDAVGVTTHEKTVPHIDLGARSKLPSLKLLFEELSRGVVDDNNLCWLCQKLVNLTYRGDRAELLELQQLFPELDLRRLAQKIELALASGALPPFVDSNEPNIERKALLALLLDNVSARKKLLEIERGYIKELPEQKDEVTYCDFTFSVDAELHKVQSFEQMLEQLTQDNDLLQLIRDQRTPIESLTADNLNHLSDLMERFYPNFSIPAIWQAYQVVVTQQDQAPATRHVVPLNPAHSRELEAITNVLALSKFAFKQSSTLISMVNPSELDLRFDHWCAKEQAKVPMADKCRPLYYALAQEISSNGAILNLRTLRHINDALFTQLKQRLTPNEASYVLSSLSSCLLLS